MRKQPRYFKFDTIHNGKKVMKYLADVAGMSDDEVGDLIDVILKDMKLPQKAKQNRPKLRQGRARSR